MTIVFMREFVLFDDSQNNRAILFDDFCGQETLLPSQLDQIDDRLHKGWQKSLYAVLFIDYEFGLPLQKLAHLGSGSLNILWFAQKTLVSSLDEWLSKNAENTPCAISTPQMNVSKDEYNQAITKIHQHIQQGDVYQINYTVRLLLTAYGSPIQLYRHLRPKIPFGVLASLPNQHWTLCFSPELFLRINADGVISAEPMKGTAPILHDEHDQQRAYDLQNDPKNRAENMMIVDLLRNDLGRLAEIGSVCVPEIFCVRDFGSVWQMTTPIHAQLKPQTTFADIVQATFPCGSITGAPKRKSMEIIHQLEKEKRHLYTGSIGFLSYEKQGVINFSGCLNVAIRTLQLTPNQGAYQGIYGVGSGIVMDSDANAEYQECVWKSQIINHLRPNFDLFETMRVENGKIPLLNKHLLRMQHSAIALNIPFSYDDASSCIQSILSTLSYQEIYRLKLTLHSSGNLKTEYAILNPLIGKQKVMISPIRLKNQDPLRCHKITHRQAFDTAWQNAEKHGAFDALLFNEDGFLLEGGRSSVMILIENQWLTPDLSLHILPSIARSEWTQHHRIIETKITQEMLHNAQSIRIGNALRGWFDVDLV